MSDIAQTQPLQERDDIDLDRDGARRPAGPGPGSADPATATRRSSRELPDPVAVAKDPDNRAKLMLATAAMTLLNLVLLLVVLANVAGGGTEEVVVDGVPCLIAEADGENVLYCAR